MAERGFLDGSGLDEFAEELVAGAAGLLFKIAGLAEMEGAEMERQTELLCEIVHELCIRSRVGPAKTVVEMDDGEAQGEFGAEFEQNVEEADGIRAAGDRDAEAVAGLEELVAGDGLADTVKKGHGVGFSLTEPNRSLGSRSGCAREFR
jgi:hypothetical protein